MDLKQLNQIEADIEDLSNQLNIKQRLYGINKPLKHSILAERSTVISSITINSTEEKLNQLKSDYQSFIKEIKEQAFNTEVEGLTIEILSFITKSKQELKTTAERLINNQPFYHQSLKLNPQKNLNEKSPTN